MIDLEEALAALVERAPAPPEMAAVARRAKRRRLRRRASALAAALVVLAGGASGAISIVSARHPSRVSTVTPTIGHVHLTMLDGSQLDVSGPPALGLSTVAPAFSAELDIPGYKSTAPSPAHSFSVERTAPADLGAVVGRYPTHDGHELVVYTTPNGVDAVVRYQDWSLVVTWNSDQPTSWAGFAAALNARETADGFLVVEPADSSWHLGPTDAPDAQLGGTGYGGGAAYSFFGPALYPNGCPTAAEATVQTPQGWPVLVGTDPSKNQPREWCDADARVRVMVGDPHLADAAVQGLRVSYTDAAHETVRVTTLDGASFDITGPWTMLDHFGVQATVAIDGLDTPEPIVVEVDRTDDSLRVADAPRRLPDAPFTSGDGHQLVVTQYPLGDVALEGAYGDWTVDVTVTGMPNADRARVASLFGAHVTAQGFLVIDPGPSMHITGGPATEIILDGADIGTAPGTAEVSYHDGTIPANPISVQPVR